MKISALQWRPGVIIILSLLLVSELSSLRSLARPRSSISAPPSCSAPEYREFDFWLGDWDAFDMGGTEKNARLRVNRILDGCVVHEDYRGADGHNGESFSIYDASRKVWHQSWVTNRGELLIIEGKMEAGGMVLTGADRTSTGQERRVRGIWKPLDGGVRETAVTSTDAGKTWTPWFDIIFRPHSDVSAARKSASTSDSKTDDARTVAALDTEFQAATKANNAAAIDRLLPDDYVLVTSSGKTFTKADLVQEARSARRHYDHQEDSEQTVRVWGDTAVITAKLWAKGTQNGKPFDYTLWFSDTYVRTGTGWRYTFAQASAPLKPALNQR